MNLLTQRKMWLEAIAKELESAQGSFLNIGTVDAASSIPVANKFFYVEITALIKHRYMATLSEPAYTQDVPASPEDELDCWLEYLMEDILWADTTEGKGNPPVPLEKFVEGKDSSSMARLFKEIGHSEGPADLEWRDACREMEKSRSQILRNIPRPVVDDNGQIARDIQPFTEQVVGRMLGNDLANTSIFAPVLLPNTMEFVFRTLGHTAYYFGDETFGLLLARQVQKIHKGR